jgi:methionine-rich copper-binding protein CopC
MREDGPVFMQSPRSRRRARAVVWVAVAGALLGLLASLLTATSAEAHARLVSQSPADGARLSKAPTQVVLTFDEPVSTSFATVAVTDSSGDSVVSGRPRVQGATVTQALEGGLASGKYTVAFRVVSDDGHPVSDKTTFTLVLPASQSPTSSASASSSPSSAPTATSVTPVTPGSDATARGSGSDSGWPLWVWVALAIVVLAAVGGTAVTLAGRRRRGL